VDHLEYIREPAEIYRQSFETIRREADLSRFSGGMEALAIRLIHACGMTDLASDIAFSPDAYEAGASALRSGAPVLCDAEMVRHGVIRRLLPAGNDVICMLGDERVRPRAIEIGNTRSAAQVDVWNERLAGAVVAIGNAPTDSVPVFWNGSMPALRSRPSSSAFRYGFVGRYGIEGGPDR